MLCCELGTVTHTLGLLCHARRFNKNMWKDRSQLDPNWMSPCLELFMRCYMRCRIQSRCSPFTGAGCTYTRARVLDLYRQTTDKNATLRQRAASQPPLLLFEVWFLALADSFFCGTWPPSPLPSPLPRALPGSSPDARAVPVVGTPS